MCSRFVSVLIQVFLYFAVLCHFVFVNLNMKFAAFFVNTKMQDLKFTKNVWFVWLLLTIELVSYKSFWHPDLAASPSISVVEYCPASEQVVRGQGFESQAGLSLNHLSSLCKTHKLLLWDFKHVKHPFSSQAGSQFMFIWAVFYALLQP